MAPSAAEGGAAAPVEPAFARWAALLAPQPGRLEFSIRLAAVCTLTTLIAIYYGTPEAALSAYMGFFIIKPDRTSSAVGAVAMVVLVALILGLVLLLGRAVIDHPAARVACMAGLSFVLLFLTSASKLKPVGSTVALVVAYCLDLLGSAPIGELATRGLLYGWLLIGLPAGVALLLSLALAPSPLALAHAALARRLRACAQALRVLDPDKDLPARPVLREGNTALNGLLRLAALEHSAGPHDLAALRQAVGASTSLFAILTVMADAPQARLPAALRELMSALMERMAQVLEQGARPVDIEPDLPRDEAIEARLQPMQAETLQALREVLSRFAEPSAEIAAPPAEPHTGFLQADAFSNPEHVRFAIKTTAAAMFCYLFYSVLSWPGIHTSMLTCFIVSLGTLADSVEKLSLRIGGCLLGAVLGLATMVFLLPGIESVWLYLLVVFAGALAAAWIAAGGPRIAYAGFQVGFAFFLCVIQGSGPSFDMLTARDRVLGILLGNVVIYLVSAQFWPVSVRGRIESAWAGAVALLRRLAVADSPAARRRLAAETQATIGALQSDLSLARYEPATVGPSQAWCASLSMAADRAADLAAALLVLGECGQHVPVDWPARLERLSMVNKNDAAESEGRTLQAWGERQLAALEAAAARHHASSNPGGRHVAA